MSCVTVWLKLCYKVRDKIPEWHLNETLSAMFAHAQDVATGQDRRTTAIVPCDPV